MNKNCIICKKNLQGNQRKYCSNKCKAKGHYRNCKNQRNTYSAQYLRSIERKHKLIQAKGGCCENCGYDKNYAVLEFHHRDESSKSFNLDSRRLSNTSWELILREADKCSLLCANCHREHHNPEMKSENVQNMVEDILESKEEKKARRQSIKQCLDCRTPLRFSAARCRKCQNKKMEKIIWPTTEILNQMVSASSYRSVAKELGVSDNAVRKRLKKHSQSIDTSK